MPYLNIAAGLVVMERNVDYKPTWVNDSPLLKDPVSSPVDYTNNAASAMCGNGHWSRAPIFRIHVAKNDLAGDYVRLWLYHTKELSPVDVPYSAFKEGSTYDMYVRKYTIVDSMGAEVSGSPDADFILIGYLVDAMPIDLM